MSTATKERAITVRDWEARAWAAGRLRLIVRPVVPQPPSVEAVHAKAGIGYSWYRCDDWEEPSRFRVVGPVWAVRELDEVLANNGLSSPLGPPGTPIWGREWYASKSVVNRGDGTCFAYRADDDRASRTLTWKWNPPRQMRRHASRLSGVVERVEVRRVREITGDEALAAGATNDHDDPEIAVNDFWIYWDHHHGKAHPWETSWAWFISIGGAP